MYISENSIFLNYPKTGSTFVRNVLEQVNRNILNSRGIFGRFTNRHNSLIFHEHLVPQIRNTVVRQNEPDPHGVCDQIPKSSLNKKIFSVYRTPIDKLKSAYKYADFKNVSYFSTEALKGYPNFPDLSFQEFVDLYYSYPPGTEDVHENVTKLIGPQTIQFVKFYFKNGISRLKDGSIVDALGCATDEMYKVELIDFKNLSERMYNCLFNLGYKDEWIRFIKTAPKVNVRKSSQELVLSPTQIEIVKQKEYLLFEIEKERGLC